MHTLLNRPRRALTALGAAIVSTMVQAAPVTYTVTGQFNGHTADDPTLIAALAPLLSAGQTLSMTLSVEPTTASAGTVGPGATLYRAITASSARFAGFNDATSSGCPSASDFICTLHLLDGRGPAPGSPFDPDQISVFPSLLHSNALDTASGAGRFLSLQLMMFVLDTSGLALSSDSPAVDLGSLDPALWRGEFGVFASNAAGGFDRASFQFNVDSVRQGTPDGGHRIPEPASLSLALAALTALHLRHRRAPAPSRS